jgi:hypothetical protein
MTTNNNEQHKLTLANLIPRIQIQEPTSSRLSTLRSQSFEIPRDKVTGVHAHFNKSDASARPKINRASLSHNEGYTLHRPSINPRKSFARSVSSFSLYSHFAGERFTQPNHRHHPSSKKNSAKSLDIEDVSIKDESNDSNYSNTSSIDEKEGENIAPKASVGKAMFMFLKAFIGSGVLFLPKA